VTTAVTCPIMRVHPAVVAQAAATTAALHQGRFVLGVGTGEALNEHILGDRWPFADERLEMLEEAVDVLRRLWQGDYVTHHGKHYTVDQAKIYTRPAEPPKVYVSAFGPKAMDVAARIADGYISTSPDAGMVKEFRDKAGKDKPVQGGFKGCWASTEDEGVEIAHRLWGTSGIPGELSQVLPSPKHFEQAAELVTPDMTRRSLPCGPDPAGHAEQLQKYRDAGFDEVYVSNIGPHYRELIDLYRREFL
jgi:G6PDH family F420-dependent oxidoreductase